MSRPQDFGLSNLHCIAKVIPFVKGKEVTEHKVDLGGVPIGGLGVAIRLCIIFERRL